MIALVHYESSDCTRDRRRDEHEHRGGAYDGLIIILEL